MKNKKPYFYGILIGLLFLVVLAFLLNLFAEQKLETTLNKDFGEELTYDELDVNLLTGKLSIENGLLKLDNGNLGVERIRTHGLSFYTYLVHGRVEIDRLVIENPEVRFYTQEADTSETSEPFEKELQIGKLEISGGSFSMGERDSEESSLFFSNEASEVENISLTGETLQEKIPFLFDSYKIQGDSLFMDLDAEHYFTAEEISFSKEGLSSRNLKIIPKYGKVEFQQHISQEKDRFDLSIKEVKLQSLEWEFRQDSLHLETPLIVIEQGNLEVYRNKLMPDDTSIKTMYSEKLRNLPAKIAIEKVEVKNSTIVYQEKIKQEVRPAEVSFTNLHASIYNLDNTGMGSEDFKRTEVEARANLMGEPLLQVNWGFDISNASETFIISGNFGELSSEGINSFLVPAMGIEARGGIESLAFNFSGNNDRATGDMEIKYRDFKVNVLKNDATEKSGFLSAIANLFINNDAINEDFQHEDLEVSRDKTKSFWNYLWLCIREGALDSFL